MARVTQDGLLCLTGYALNPGVCKALGSFLEKNTAKYSPYLVKALVLADNRMSDSDFANILNGLLKQQNTQHICYS